MQENNREAKVYSDPLFPTGFKAGIHSLATENSIHTYSWSCFVSALIYVDLADWPLNPRQFRHLHRLLFPLQVKL